MNINHKDTVTISGHHINITSALELNAKNIASKLQTKFNNITHMHFMLKVDTVHPHLQHAEAEVVIAGKREAIFAKSSSMDMYKSLHKLGDKLYKQIVKYKEITNAHGEHHHMQHHHYNSNNKFDYGI